MSFYFERFHLEFKLFEYKSRNAILRSFKYILRFILNTIDIDKNCFIQFTYFVI